ERGEILMTPPRNVADVRDNDTDTLIDSGAARRAKSVARVHDIRNSHECLHYATASPADDAVFFGNDPDLTNRSQIALATGHHKIRRLRLSMCLRGKQQGGSKQQRAHFSSAPHTC